MKLKKIFYFLLGLSPILVGCNDEQDDAISAGVVNLSFENVYKNSPIILGDAQSTKATVLSSSLGQSFRFKEIKYVVSNIRLVKSDGKEEPYYTQNLDKGAFVINQADEQSLQIKMHVSVPDIKAIKFGIGVEHKLNELDEEKFPIFYKKAGRNDTELHWEWSNGYRFAKIEGFYTDENKPFVVHTGSTLQGKKNDPSTWALGINAYREVELSLKTTQKLQYGKAVNLVVSANWGNFFEGIEVEDDGNTLNVPSVHNASNMEPYADNMSKMFSLRVK